MSKFKLRISDFLRNALKNELFRNVAIVGITTLLVRATGFLKEMVIANNFGLSELVDTFLIAFLIPSFITGVFMSAFKNVFVTNYIIESKTSKNIGAFQSSCFIVSILSSIVFTIIAVLFTDVYLEFFFSGHTEGYYELVKIQFYYIAPIILISGFSSLISSLLNIANEFFLTTLSAILIPLSIIVSLLFFSEELGNKVLAVGTTIGFFGVFIFQLILALKRKIIVLAYPDFRSDNIRILFKQIPAKLTSGLLTGINPMVDQYFSAQLIIGSIAALNFGIKVPALITAIGGLAIGKVLLPHFSKSAVDDVNRTYLNMKKIIKNISVTTIVIVILVFIFSNQIVALIFEGNEFTSDDTTIVARIQQMYLIQMPFYLSSLVMVNFLVSINRNSFMAFASLISFILNIVLNYYLMKTLEVYGLALSTSIVSIVNCIILGLYIRHLRSKEII